MYHLATKLWFLSLLLLLTLRSAAGIPVSADPGDSEDCTEPCLVGFRLLGTRMGRNRVARLASLERSGAPLTERGGHGVTSGAWNVQDVVEGQYRVTSARS